MSTITAKKQIEINTLKELVDLIKEHGTDNVDIHYFHPLFENFELTDITEFLSLAKKTDISDFITNAMSNKAFIQKVATMASISIDDVYNKIIQHSLELEIYLHRVHDNISLEHLYALLEKDLLDLYHVENAKNIDADFVRKYHERMDLYSLLNSTQNSEIRELTDELIHQE